VWGALGLDFYLLDVYRERLESPDLRRAIIPLHERHGAAAMLIGETELGRALAQDLYQTGHLHAITLRPERNKLTRLLAQAARFEAGQVHLPKNAPWLATYLTELLGFPQCAARRSSRFDLAGAELADRRTPCLCWKSNPSILMV
jgi:predicted phage terminase large subunit-like protein